MMIADHSTDKIEIVIDFGRKPIGSTARMHRSFDGQETQGVPYAHARNEERPEDPHPVHSAYYATI